MRIGLSSAAAPDASPEGSAQEGLGVGSLMARLAVAGFGGTVALAPSSERYRVV